jgi:hypothetical protein
VQRFLGISHNVCHGTGESLVKPLHNLGRCIFLSLCLSAGTATAETSSTPTDGDAIRPGQEMENLKQAALDLNRDLQILEEELLFPANTQLVVFVSLDVGDYFRLGAVKLKIGDSLVASHLYTDRQNDALSRGGIQRLYIGNLKTGAHELTAFFTGVGPENRDYQRAASMTLTKGQESQMLELRIRDSTATMQPEFEFKEWQL